MLHEKETGTMFFGPCEAWLLLQLLSQVVLGFGEHYLPQSTWHDSENSITHGQKVHLYSGILTLVADQSQYARRQALAPPITLQPTCDMDDGLFFVTPQNSTFQIQCSSTYSGTILGETSTPSYIDCILTCEQLNTNISPGFCVGVSFNGTDDAFSGNCTGYGRIKSLEALSADVTRYDSALLIYGPDGSEYAAPAANQSIASTLASSSVWMTDPSSTISSTSATSVTALPNTIDMTTTTVSMSNGGQKTLQSSAPSHTTPYMQHDPSYTTLPMSPFSSAPTGSISAQITSTTVIPYTIYQVQVVAMCSASASACSLTTVTTTVVSHRTQISCSPGQCSALRLTSDATVSVAAESCVALN